MKLTFKDLLIIGAATVLSFPILYLIVLFATGNARVEFGKKMAEEVRQDDLKIIRMSHHRDSLLSQHSVAYRAVLKEREEIEEKAKLLSERESRISMLEQELEQQKNALAAERERLEKAVSESDVASEKKIRELARVYGAMRPAEAAQILETLNDEMVVQIIRAIGDDRQKGKIMGAISPAKAARLSRFMGKVD